MATLSSKTSPSGLATLAQGALADSAVQPNDTSVGRIATYGGTANAITVTTGLSLAALVTGMEIRFLATATNTGATTINVDGIGVVTAFTVTGAALPADYIRTDVDTVARYDGTNWIVSRAVESGSNANGDWTRWEDGTQTIGVRIINVWSVDSTISSGVFGYRSDDYKVTSFPANFISVPATATCSKWSINTAQLYNALAYQNVWYITTATSEGAKNRNWSFSCYGFWY